MCGNKFQVPNVESSSLHDVGQVAPITKTFGYTKYYLYGENDKKIEYEEMKLYVVEVVSVNDSVSCVLHDIHDTKSFTLTTSATYIFISSYSIFLSFSPYK